MKRIAILADIHANLPALEAVIDDIARQGVDEVLVGGDLVGRGPQGTAVVERVRELGWPSVRGNHEDYLLSFVHGDVPAEWLETEEWAASRWMADELATHSAELIAALPFSLTSRVAPELRLVHGSPRSNCEGIGSWTPDDDVDAHLARIEEPLLVCAHTHRPMERRLERGLVVNVGSVGLPFNGDWRAQYAILTRDDAGWQAEFRAAPYDRDALLAHYEASGFLADGGVTAALLRIEVERARPYLVPFLKWAQVEELEPASRHLERFLALYDDSRPLTEFYEMYCVR